MRILFVCPRLPFPPVKGDKHRAYYQIREISKKHQITLLTFWNRDASDKDQLMLKDLCERMIVVPHNKWSATISILSNLFTNMPIQCAYYHSQMMRRYLRREILNKRFDLIHIQLTRMAPYLAQMKNIAFKVPILLDFIDSLSLNMRKRLDKENLILKPLFFYEWYKMKNYETKLGQLFDGAIISSPFDQSMLPYGKEMEVLPSGVDLDCFHYCSGSNRESNTIIFTGNMHYFPNINAVIFFARRIYPLIKKIVPEAKFKIVGSNPVTEVKKLRFLDKSIEVTGHVDNILNHLSKATVAIAPMLSGSGIQIKVLEAMASGTPMVASSLATRAIDLKPNRDIMVADDPAGFAKAVVELLRNSSLREQLSINARRLVEEKYSWPAIGHRLENIYQKTIDSFNKNKLHAKSRRF